MPNYRTTVKHLLANAVFFLVFVNLLWAVSFAWFADYDYFFWFLALPFGLMYIARLKAANPIIFTFVHALLLLGAVFFIGDVDSWMLVLGFMAVALLYSYYTRIHGEPSVGRSFAVYMLILHVVVFIILDYMTADAERMQSVLLFNFIAMAGFIVVITHMDNVDYRLQYLRLSSKYDHNADRVLSFNNKMITLFAVFFMGVGFAGAVLPMGAALVRLLRWVFWPVLSVMRLVPGGIETFFEARDGDTAPVPPPLEGPQEELTEYEPEVPPYEPEYLDEGALTVFFIVVGVLSIAAALAFLLYLFRLFYRRFSARRAALKKASAQDDAVIAMPTNILSDLKALFPRIKIRHRHAIRRAYTKKVNTHIKAGTKIIAADTTVVIADKIRPRENIDELTAQYEAVRYGPER
ncbi:MAG: hypothetical protein FWB88_11105 [Defluviitaleaceae bacterium]|nr:hypothetical protein [Defluviitaleaceae bacterium]MCL2240577.1 hypothetical protein [Defluviitaleaceae bacterium]